MTCRDRNIWALIPVKRFDQAKQRLSAVLSPNDRAALAKTMLCDVLRAIKDVPQLAGMAVITNDVEAAALAQSYGAGVLNDPYPSGTNAAVAAGLSRLRTDGAGAVLVVPADIPLVRCDDIQAVICAGDKAPLVLVPALRDEGTNMLLQDCRTSLQHRFGPDSFPAHLAAAREAGLTVEIVHRAMIGLDMDEPADVARLLMLDRGCATRRLLRHLAEPNLAPPARLAPLCAGVRNADERHAK